MTELTALAARNAKPRDAMYRLAAGKGLYLQVMPNGAKYWRLKYRHLKKQPKMISLGVFPQVGLAEARAERDRLRQLINTGIDPSTQRRADRLARELATENSLEAIARAWFTEKRSSWVESYARGVISRLENNVFPWLGALPITEVIAPQILTTMQRIHERGATETAHRTRNYLSEVFRFAIRNGFAERDPAADVVGAIPAAETVHFPTLTEPSDIGGLLRAIDGYRGTHITRYALKLSPLVFTRPGELRYAEWREIDLAHGVWTVPGMRLKMRKAKKAKAEPHVVPLSKQATQLLKELHELTGAGRYLFPGERSSDRPMSENTVNAALHALGYKGQIVAHGFRHMASTALNEAGWDKDAIERQLAHKDRNRIRGIYNKAQYITERRQMMQAWSDYLDRLRLGDGSAEMRRMRESKKADA
ncbi:Integrase [Dyella sp. OK004]|uniref:tyrosine-type recombinase/integrase n=1 Tax=Dyella sp. OK004 TaxID=1855292 RepID=UPI0008E4CFF8|nr:integrase arm-type DNA-binding domain-containing protein [Dyella sp. OK004]SFR94399.1 Integrase [Dyella sp. OK004]